MAKYRFIGNTRIGRECNKVYDGESKANAWCYSVSELAIKFPYKWQLIQEKPMCTEKTITGYYLIKKKNKKTIK